jgi:hypothetical protein
MASEDLDEHEDDRQRGDYIKTRRGDRDEEEGERAYELHVVTTACSDDKNRGDGKGRAWLASLLCDATRSFSVFAATTTKFARK